MKWDPNGTALIFSCICAELHTLQCARTQRNSAQEHSGTVHKNTVEQCARTQWNSAEQCGTVRKNTAEQCTRTQWNSAQEHSGTVRKNTAEQCRTVRNSAQEHSGTVRNSAEQCGTVRKNTAEQCRTVRNSAQEHSGTVRNSAEQCGTVRKNTAEQCRTARNALLLFTACTRLTLLCICRVCTIVCAVVCYTMVLEKFSRNRNKNMISLNETPVQVLTLQTNTVTSRGRRSCCILPCCLEVGGNLKLGEETRVLGCDVTMLS
ncbi:uncharacterized protein LOC124379303 isoform X2 [Silurus meridionalis]|uniref:uncharacterized protein LOC124379303 isoform X2 n=1 Tax=Silurus meridionalis TaxID=175797 RepID=UPI001EEA00A9|nr:uncharacterized protein LOC124379303 isoform X2 [Silurus meridionalis]